MNLTPDQWFRVGQVAVTTLLFPLAKWVVSKLGEADTTRREAAEARHADLARRLDEHSAGANHRLDEMNAWLREVGADVGRIREHIEARFAEVTQQIHVLRDHSREATNPGRPHRNGED